MENGNRTSLAKSLAKKIVIPFLICVFGTSCEVDSDGLDVGEENQALSAKGGTGFSLENLLNDSLLSWTNDVNVAPENLAQFNVVSLKDAILKTEETVDLGCSVSFQNLESYINEAGMEVINEKSSSFRTNNQGDFVKFTTPVNLDATGLAEYSVEAAEEKTQQLFSALSIPKEEQGVTFSSPVIQKTSEGAKTIAQHARITREINGLRVPDSVIMATYNMDGTLLRMTANWPEFHTKQSNYIKTRQEAIGELKEYLTEDMIDSIINVTGNEMSQDFELGMLSTLVYEKDKRGEYYEPVLYVGFTDNKDQIFPQSVKYSLVDGILEDDNNGDDL